MKYLSITSPPPPPISKILTLTLPRSLTYALRSFPSLTTSPLPDLSPVLGRLKSLTPSPGLETGFRLLKAEGARVLIITNGSKGTTEEYVRQAGLGECVDGVQSCDEIGMGKPFGQVYEAATQLCEQTSGREGERWFVAAHMWDVCAARKAGCVVLFSSFLYTDSDVGPGPMDSFKTGAVLSEQPPLGNEELDQWWELWGGKPDVIGMDLEEVARGIIASSTAR